MENKITAETEKCIICLGEVAYTSGHVLKGKEVVLAGWCEEHHEVHLKSGNQTVYLNRKLGCYGGWIESYGYKERPI